MKNKYILGVCGAAALALATSAYASNDQLRYSINGANWVTVTDGGVGDLDGANDNNILVSIGTAGFHLTITTSGFSVGTPGSPDVDLNVGGGFTSAGTIILEYTDTGFNPVPTGTYTLHAGGSVTGGVSVDNYAFLGANTPFAGTDPVAPSSPFPPTVSPGGIIGPLTGLGDTTHGAFPAQPSPYSVTIVQSITVRSAGSISDDMRLSVPDGGNTLMMLGSALSVLGLGVFRRKAVKA